MNQLFTEAQIEGRDDTDSSNMACLCQADTKTGVENGDLKIRTSERERVCEVEDYLGGYFGRHYIFEELTKIIINIQNLERHVSK